MCFASQTLSEVVCATVNTPGECGISRYAPGLFHLGRGVREEEKACVSNVASLKWLSINHRHWSVDVNNGTLTQVTCNYLKKHA